MTAHEFTPTVRQPITVDPVTQAALAADLQALRDKQAAQRLAHAAADRALLITTGVSDVDAALACACACHPRTHDTHDGGRSCPCQLDEAARQAQHEAWVAEWDTVIATFADPDLLEQRAARDAVFEARAAELGVVLIDHGGGAPYVIRGVVDGRAFFLRERHDAWRVEIAGDDDPGEDPWGSSDMTTIVVAAGDSDQFSGDRFELDALETAVGAVRRFLARRSCTHVGMQAYCPSCGVAVGDAPAWRIRTDVDGQA